MRLGHIDCLQFCLDHGYSMFGAIDNVVEVLSALDMKKEIDWSIPLLRDKYFEIYKAYPTLQGRIAELIKPHYEEFETLVMDACEKWIPGDVIKHVLLCY